MGPRTKCVKQKERQEKKIPLPKRQPRNTLGSYCFLLRQRGRELQGLRVQKALVCLSLPEMGGHFNLGSDCEPQIGMVRWAWRE